MNCGSRDTVKSKLMQVNKRPIAAFLDADMSSLFDPSFKPVIVAIAELDEQMGQY